MTGAAFQAEVSLNKQATDPKSHTLRIPVISDTDSGGKPDTHSSRSRTPIPVIPDTP